MTTRSELTTRDELVIPNAPTKDEGLLTWAADFVRSFKTSFRIHKHVFPAVMDGELEPRTYTVATLPNATKVRPGSIIYVSDGGAGAVFRGCNGSTWVSLG